MKHNNTSKWWDERMPEAVSLILKGYGLTELGIHFGKSTAAVSQALHKRGVSINVLRAKSKAECDRHHEEVITLANAMRQNRELRARVAELEQMVAEQLAVIKERDKYKARYDLAIEKEYPKKKFPSAYAQEKALKEQGE